MFWITSVDHSVIVEQIKVALEIFGRWGEGGLYTGVGVGVGDYKRRSYAWIAVGGGGGDPWDFSVSNSNRKQCEVKPCVVLCHKTVFLKITGDKVAFKTTDKLNTIRN